MAIEDEFERTFLAKFIPEGLEKCEFVELEDNYIPKDSNHPILRIRKKGDKTVITKKYKKKEGDASIMIEETIPLTPEEYNFINQLEGKKFSKKRYSYEYEEGKFCEVDVYQDKLKGLVVIDFEFNNVEEKDSFEMPNFCLVEVTNEEFLAGGMLCGKSYEDLKIHLEKFNYKKIG
jgi:CYTH domain-containing protein